MYSCKTFINVSLVSCNYSILGDCGRLLCIYIVLNGVYQTSLEYSNYKKKDM